ncbi:MAG TPA: hypothetical protein VL262_11995 [Vicinamibacterales bacterium]|jgi:hypothetical protein|nr:hypothetical protein [Vicinamibacterales bacterium]
MSPTSVQQRFKAALDSLVEEARRDRTILATILCGSLSHDTVWEKSDIDLVFVTTDDVKEDPEREGVSLYADGLNVHAILLPRTSFRKTVEGALRNSFAHSFLAKGTLLYSHDPTIAALCERLQEIGARDSQLQLLRAAAQALPSVYKARKWFVTREDLDYTALWILYAATPLAQAEVFGRRLLADREVLPQALALNPGFFSLIYTGLLNARKTRAAVEAALTAIDQYLENLAPRAFAPVLEYLREAGEPRSAREIDHHFRRTFGIPFVTTACEYLADQGRIAKVSTPVRVTKKSNVQLQETAFFSLEPPTGYEAGDDTL